MKYTLLRASAMTASAAVLAALSASAPAQTRPPVASPGMSLAGQEARLSLARDRIDPARSYAAMLFRREDVRFELNLTRRQWGQLEDLENKSQAELQDKMRGTLGQGSPGATLNGTNGQNALGNAPDTANPNAGPTQNGFNTPPQTPEARRQQVLQRAALMRQRMEQMSALANSDQGDLDKQTAAILTPAQQKRLHQIDFQFRGPLALLDPKLGQDMNLTPDQREGITAALQNYRAVQARAFQIAVQGMPRSMPNTPTGSPNGPIVLGEQSNAARRARSDAALNSPQRMAELQERLAEARTISEQAKQAAGEKVLAALTPTQRAQWRAWTGKPMRWMDQN